jgi:hypothetical protein
MKLDFTPDSAADEPELFIHLDIEGLAALLRAVESAMRTGRGQLGCEDYGANGTIVGSGSPSAFARVIVTFDTPGREARTARPN